MVTDMESPPTFRITPWHEDTTCDGMLSVAIYYPGVTSLNTVDVELSATVLRVEPVKGLFGGLRVRLPQWVHPGSALARFAPGRLLRVTARVAAPASVGGADSKGEGPHLSPAAKALGRSIAAAATTPEGGAWACVQRGREALAGDDLEHARAELKAGLKMELGTLNPDLKALANEIKAASDRLRKQAAVVKAPSAQYSADEAHIDETLRTGEYVGTLRWDESTKLMPLPSCRGTLFGVELNGKPVRSRGVWFC